YGRGRSPKRVTSVGSNPTEGTTSPRLSRAVRGLLFHEQLQLGEQPFLRIVQVESADRCVPTYPVAQRVGVDVQPLGGCTGIAEDLQVGQQGPHQIRTCGAVVLEEATDQIGRASCRERG